MNTPILIFDGDCGFCTSSVRWLKRTLRRGPGEAAVIPWQRCDLAALGVDPQQVRDEVVWIAVDGSHAGGADAVAAWLRWQPGALRTLGRMQRWALIRPLSRAAYRTIARNRHRLPGGTPACER